MDAAPGDAVTDTTNDPLANITTDTVANMADVISNAAVASVADATSNDAVADDVTNAAAPKTPQRQT